MMRRETERRKRKIEGEREREMVREREMRRKERLREAITEVDLDTQRTGTHQLIFLRIKLL